MVLSASALAGEFSLLTSVAGYERLRNEMNDSELRTRIFIENQVNKRIDSLFDGYKLTDEKQWELERKLENLEARLEQLEVQAG